MTTEDRKRVEITLPTDSYALLKKAADGYGVTVKNFVAMSVMDRVMDVLQRLQATRRESIALSEAEWDRLQSLLRHPEVPSDAKKRLDTMAEDVVIEVKK